MTEKKFDELLQDTEIELSLNKKIKNGINRKIYSKIIRSFIALCILIVGLYHGISFVFDQTHYNPYREEKFSTEDVQIEFAVLLSNYIQMHYPGKLCILENYEENPYQSLGFGKYEVNMKLQSSFDPLYIDGKSNIKFTIDKSHLSFEVLDNQMLLTQTVDEFKNSGSAFQEIHSLKDVYAELQDLPNSTWLDVSVSFENFLSLEQIVQLIKKYSDAGFEWIALKDQETSIVEGIANGMSLYDATRYCFTAEFEKKYSGYYLPSNDELTADDLKQNYLSKLQMLIDHPDFLKILYSAFPYQSNIDKLKQNYEKASQEMLSYGVRVYINKKDLISMIDNENVSYVYINDMKLSQYQR